MSIVDKLTYLNTTKQLLKTEINKINNVLTDNSTFRSYPQELFNGYLDILNNGTDTLWNNLEKVSQTGTEVVLENVETAPIKMVLNGNTSQDGTPTPDYPQQVKVVKGENVVSVHGKNLFDIDTITKNKTIDLNTGEVVVDTNDRDTSDFILVTNSVTYSCNVTMTRIAFYDKSKNFISMKAIQPSVVTPDNCKYVRFSYDNSLSNIQFERGLSSEFTPNAKTYPISLGTLELCKIGDYKDYFHKDSGKWYVHKAIKKVVFNGTENWSSGYAQLTNYFTGELKDVIVDIDNSKTSLSNYFVRLSAANERKEGITYLTYNNSKYFDIRLLKTRVTTLENFKTWLSTHNTIVYYILATPTETEITNTTLISQLEAISKAKSVKDKTYITQTNEELPFILDVEAIKEYEVN